MLFALVVQSLFAGWFMIKGSETTPLKFKIKHTHTRTNGENERVMTKDKSINAF